MLEDVANNPVNRLGSDRYENVWYAEIQPDGRQIWARVRNGVIDDGGINDSPLQFNPETGLCRPTKP